MRLAWLSLLAFALVGSCCAQGLLSPAGVAFDAAGNLYVADAHRNQVVEVTVGGQTVVVAGTGSQGFGGDGGDPGKALLSAPLGVAVASDGTVYVADTGNARVRAVSGGVIRTVAGTGVPGFAGDGGDALAARLMRPVALAVASDGAVWIADSGNHRVRRLSGGVVATFAGSGVQGFGGDGGKAVAAMLDTPLGVAVMSDGRVLIADAHNHRLRVVAADGTITTFAGNGVRGFAGDGGKATAASLNLPRGVAVMADGSVVFADSDNQRLRRVDAAGVISTIAGNGVQGAGGQGTAGNVSMLNGPRGVALSKFGDAVFADARNAKVKDLADDAAVYVAASRTATVTLSAGAAGTVTAVVGGESPDARGVVTVMEGGVPVGSGAVVSGSVTLPVSGLSAGAHTLTARYSGDGVHVAAVSPALIVTTGKAAVTVTANAPAVAYAGLPMTMTARVQSQAAGVPTGTVTFSENGTAFATASLSGGAASGVYLNPTAGTHTVVAGYAGDANFSGALSSPVVVTVGAVPDFAMTAPVSSQTVKGGAATSFTVNVSGAPGPFTGSVTFVASGLPKGATVAFSPNAVVPGSSSVPVTMTVQTVTQARVWQPEAIWVALVTGGICCWRRRRVAGLLVVFLGLTGCGDRRYPTQGVAPQSFEITVTGTATNVVGAVVVHRAVVTLTVE